MRSGDYICITTTKIESYENIEDGERPYVDFEFGITGPCELDFRLMKSVLQIYDHHRNMLLENPEKQSVTSKICIESIVTRDK